LVAAFIASSNPGPGSAGAAGAAAGVVEVAAAGVVAAGEVAADDAEPFAAGDAPAPLVDGAAEAVDFGGFVFAAGAPLAAAGGVAGGAAETI